MSETEINTSEVSASKNDDPETKTTPSNEEVEKGVDESSGIQLEPTQDEMETERLTAKAEQLQDEIQKLHEELADKEAELADVKKQLGITPFVEFKQSVSHGFKVVGDKFRDLQETETFRKIDTTLSGWKQKVEESGSYQKTVTALNDGGKKVSGGFSSAGTKIRENETLKNVGEKTSSALKRTGTAIKDTGSSVGTKISSAASSLKEKVWTSTDQADEPDGSVPSENRPTTGETVVPDEPSKNE